MYSILLYCTQIANRGRPNVEDKQMRKSFVQCETRKQAETECPWASKIEKVEGGYMCFESISDYETWKNQK